MTTAPPTGNPVIANLLEQARDTDPNGNNREWRRHLLQSAADIDGDMTYAATIRELWRETLAGQTQPLCDDCPGPPAPALAGYSHCRDCINAGARFWLVTPPDPYRRRRPCATCSDPEAEAYYLPGEVCFACDDDTDIDTEIEH